MKYSNYYVFSENEWLNDLEFGIAKTNLIYMYIYLFVLKVHVDPVLCFCL